MALWGLPSGENSPVEKTALRNQGAGERTGALAAAPLHTAYVGSARLRAAAYGSANALRRFSIIFPKGRTSPVPWLADLAYARKASRRLPSSS